MPNNWKTYKLAEVANLVTGFAFKSKFYENDGDLRVIRGKNITEGYLRWGDDARFWNHSLEKLERYTVQEDDIVIGMDGSKIGKNRAIIRKHDLPAILAQRVAMVRAKDGRAEQKYLWQLINNSPFENYVENVKTGTSIPHISLGQVGNFEIILPSLPEQQAIASILSSLDDKIELNLQMNKTLEEMAMTLYKHWFVDFGPFKDGSFVESELGLIPEGWEVKSVYSIANFINGAAFKAKDFVEDKSEGLPVIKIAEIKQGITSQTMYSNKELDAKYTIENNDILFPWSGNPHTSLGIHLWDKGKALLNQHVFVVRVDGAESKCFVFNALKNLLPTFINLATHKQTTGLGHVTVANLKELKIPFPNTDALLKYNKQATSSLDLMYSNQIENIMLTSLRDTLLPKLITGAIRVKEAEQSLASIM